MRRGDSARDGGGSIAGCAVGCAGTGTSGGVAMLVLGCAIVRIVGVRVLAAGGGYDAREIAGGV